MLCGFFSRKRRQTGIFEVSEPLFLGFEKTVDFRDQCEKLSRVLLDCSLLTQLQPAFFFESLHLGDSFRGPIKLNIFVIACKFDREQKDRPDLGLGNGPWSDAFLRLKSLPVLRVVLQSKMREVGVRCATQFFSYCACPFAHLAGSFDHMGCVLTILFHFSPEAAHAERKP